MELKQRDRIEIVILLALCLFLSAGLFTLVSLKAEAALTPSEPEAVPVAAARPTPLPSLMPIPTPEPTPELRAQTDLVRLCNPGHMMPEGYVPELALAEGEEYVDVRCSDPLVRMLADCRDAGCAPYICSGYRTMEKQTYLYYNKVDRVMAQGYGRSDALVIASASVAIPGASEHQLGLAVDIIDYNYPYLNTEQENTATQQWLMENCWNYGFILRYPTDKSDVTGTVYEPWHYRYVGLQEALEMRELGMTLEEYLAAFYAPMAEETGGGE